MLTKIEGLTLKRSVELELKRMIEYWQVYKAIPDKDYMITFFHGLLVYGYLHRQFANPDLIPKPKAIHTLKNLARYAVLKYFKHGIESLYGGSHA